ncbi:hypothetical protein G7Z17_g6440 [Cylindrodendrum hubeiense]|uniref:SAM dependent carboxyl methyltransferase n=1 Tax=Cylindrodendrum hubeiense TaxID=595255 RepID=A0A9P5H9V6_9HYPO|nr:hypothetical protein G7Z17_g6440 [Cylindrodendrum hubeiense]
MSSEKEQTRIAMRDRLYNEYSWLQCAAMQAGLALLPRYSDDRSLMIIDYGCGQGANSLQPLNLVLESVPDGATVEILFEDTPFNDFSTLAKTLGRGIPYSSLAKRDVTVFLKMVPTGFYNPIIPQPKADLGISWTSMNYLESQPNVTLNPAATPADFLAAKHEAFAAAAQKDLIKFLKLRANEIRDGGYFVAAIGSQKPKSEVVPSNPGFKLLQSVLVQMVGKGSLTYGELTQFALFPSHERTPEELQEALQVPEIEALWAVESLESKLVVHPAWLEYQETIELAGTDEVKKKTALEVYARAVTLNLVSASGWFWLEVLKHHRGPSWNGGDAFLEELTELSIREWVESSDESKVEIWYIYLKLKRLSEETQK